MHARHATEAGCKAIMFKANDIDVIVIVVGVLQSLQELGLQELWVAFGQRPNMRWVGVHLGEKSSRMLFSHAFTGSDHSVAKGRNLLRKPGMFVIRLPVLSANSASTHL